MTTLDYNGQSRTTNDPAVIETMVRKGWTVRPEPPAYNPNNQMPPAWDGAQWVVAPLPEAQRIARIKGEAGRRAMAVFGPDMPSVLLAIRQGLKLANKRGKGGQLNAGEAAIEADLEAKDALADAIHAHAAALVADPNLEPAWPV